jgi:hypothetical protein
MGMAHVRAGGARHSFLHGVWPFRRVRDDVSIRLVELGDRQAVMMDHDLVSQAMKEAQRLSVDPVGPNPFKREPAIEVLREVLNDKQQQKTVAGQPDRPMANLDSDKAIHLRWTLRDINAKRTKLSPLNPDDLRVLIEMGLVEMREDQPALTNAGLDAIS